MVRQCGVRSCVVLRGNQGAVKSGMAPYGSAKYGEGIKAMRNQVMRGKGFAARCGVASLGHVWELRRWQGQAR